MNQVKNFVFGSAIAGDLVAWRSPTLRGCIGLSLETNCTGVYQKARCGYEKNPTFIACDVRGEPLSVRTDSKLWERFRLDHRTDA